MTTDSSPERIRLTINEIEHFENRVAIGSSSRLIEEARFQRWLIRIAAQVTGSLRDRPELLDPTSSELGKAVVSILVNEKPADVFSVGFYAGILAARDELVDTTTLPKFESTLD